MSSNARGMQQQWDVTSVFLPWEQGVALTGELNDSWFGNKTMQHSPPESPVVDALQTATPLGDALGDPLADAWFR